MSGSQTPHDELAFDDVVKTMANAIRSIGDVLYEAYRTSRDEDVHHMLAKLDTAKRVILAVIGRDIEP